MKKRFPRHIVIPLCIFIYFCVMAYMGRDMILVQHNYLGYFGTIAAELAVLIALYFFLKKRDKLRQERLNDMNKSANKQDSDNTSH